MDWNKAVAADRKVNEGYVPQFKVGDVVRDTKWGHKYTVVEADHLIASAFGDPHKSFTLRGSKNVKGKVGDHFDNPERFELATPASV